MHDLAANQNMQRFPGRECFFTELYICDLTLPLTHTHAGVIGKVHLPDVAARSYVSQGVC